MKLRRDPPAGAGGSRRWAGLGWLLLAGILALGVFLRFYRLAELPPGLNYDEAFYGLDALRVLTEGVHPIFFVGNNGREPIFIYLLAGAFEGLGASPFTMRLVSATLGALALPAIYLLVRETFRSEDRWFARAAALFSTLALATLYWHVHHSRLALRAIQLPLFEALALWLFWRALQREQRRDFLAAGLLLGVSMYTYLAARLLPFLLALLLLLWMVQKRDFLRRQWQNVVWLFGTSLAISLPLWVYLLRNPFYLTFRLQQISLDNPVESGDAGVQLATNLRSILLMFTTAGDYGWLNNLPGRPVLDAATMAGFFLGLLVVLRRFRDTRFLQWPLWLAAMLSPTLFTLYAPHYTRGIGAVVPIAALVGIGWGQIVAWVGQWGSHRITWAALAVLLLAVGAFSGWSTYRDYFQLWGSQTELYDAFDMDMHAAAAAVTSLPGGSEVYVSFKQLGSAYDAGLDFYVSSTQLDTGAPGYLLRYHNSLCLVAPDSENTVAYLLPPNDDTFSPTLHALYPGGEMSSPARRPDGSFPFLLFQSGGALNPAAKLSPGHPAAYQLDDSLELLGYDSASADMSPGSVLDLILYWRVRQPLPISYTIFLQLLGEQLNADGNPVWGQQDTLPCDGSFPTTAWEPGDVILTRHVVPVAAGAPPGSYELVAGMYDLASGVRLPVFDASGQATADNAALLSVITVP